jgi:anti-sigma factor RsiW
MKVDELRLLPECRRTRRRLQRFLDRDPSAPLTAAEELEVQAHLEICGRCQALAADFTALHASLARLGAHLVPDQEALDRLHGFLDSVVDQEPVDPE